MNNNVGIILTSIERPSALKESIQSILNNWQDNWMLFIGDQDTKNNYNILTEIAEQNTDKKIHIYNLGYNIGISKARNELIKKAYLENCTHILLTADSIIFNDSMLDINFIIQQMEKQQYDMICLNLHNRIAWEANLTLIPNHSFQLDFIDSNEKTMQLFVPISIGRNFWIANTASLMNVPYDEYLVMLEHEDFFHRYKLAGYKVACTNFCSGTYKKSTNSPKYDTIRQQNFSIGKKRLLEKWNLKLWVSYVHLERIKP